MIHKSKQLIGDGGRYISDAVSVKFEIFPSEPTSRREKSFFGSARFF
jgi:hypothetical protein